MLDKRDRLRHTRSQVQPSTMNCNKASLWSTKPVDQCNPCVLVLSLTQEGRGNGLRLTKPSGFCRATNLSMQSTYADSKTPVIPPAVLCIAQITAMLQAPKWQTTLLPSPCCWLHTGLRSNISSSKLFFQRGLQDGRMIWNRRLHSLFY